MTGTTGTFTSPPQSYWLASTTSTAHPALDSDITVDIAIVGGGLVGITVAYLLKQENLTVAVLEADRIGQGTTGRTTAKITSQHSLIYSKLIKRLGLEKARQYAQANEKAIRFIENLVNTKKIDCDFSPQAAYVYTREDQYIKAIEEEVSAAASLGIKAHFVEQSALPFEIKAAERFDNQGQFHPRKYLLTLAKDIPGGGSQIFEKTRAIDFQEGRPFTIITDGGYRVRAESVVIASHFPAYGGDGYYFARVYPERAYALAITAQEQFPGGIYIAAEPEGQSLRSTPYNGGELIIIVGGRHRTGQGPPMEDHYRSLARFAEQTFSVTGTPYRWSAQDYTSLDELPYAGRLSPNSANVYVATGFRKWGISNGTASALLLKDLIVHGESPYEAVYDPARFKADPMIKSAVSVDVDIAVPPAHGKFERLPTGTEPAPGKAMVVAGEKGNLGLYKDEKGIVHAVNLVCTHMGCEPVWNGAELSWDCPCHGSRFTYEGDIVEGPALKPLDSKGDRYNP
ncbi:MAG TPA: FAD-dependent oxidoreductase [Firmicutes bacterium]|jgi:glycine/D-amino acid oxidase-like deaminating enzyme/nitrite reductase/ring-hydroxylating ferredoxin subunit|nr:FAD-dependent oxidoreductase [Bacillota bacterium]